MGLAAASMRAKLLFQAMGKSVRGAIGEVKGKRKAVLEALTLGQNFKVWLQYGWTQFIVGSVEGHSAHALALSRRLALIDVAATAAESLGSPTMLLVLVGHRVMLRGEPVSLRLLMELAVLTEMFLEMLSEISAALGEWTYARRLPRARAQRAHTCTRRGPDPRLVSRRARAGCWARRRSGSS